MSSQQRQPHPADDQATGAHDGDWAIAVAVIDDWFAHEITSRHADLDAAQAQDRTAVARTRQLLAEVQLAADAWSTRRYLGGHHRRLIGFAARRAVAVARTAAPSAAADQASRGAEHRLRAFEDWSRSDPFAAAASGPIELLA